MKRKFTNVFLLVAIGIAALTSFVSCKDYEDDLRTESSIQNAQLEKQINTLRAELQQQIDSLTKWQNECKVNCKSEHQAIYNYIIQNYYNKVKINDTLSYYWKGTTADIQALIDASATTGEVGDKIKEAGEAADSALKKADELAEMLEEDYVTRDELVDSVNSLNILIGIAEGKAIAAQTTANQALTAAQNAQATANQAIADAATAAQKADAAQTAADAAKVAADAAQNTADEAKRKAETAIDDAAAAKEAADSAQVAADAAKAAADAAQVTADQAKADAAAAQATADAANALAENLKPRVEALESAVNTLNSTVATLQQDLTKLGTRVEEVADTARAAYFKAQTALDNVTALQTEYETTKADIYEKLGELAAKDAELAAKDAELEALINQDFDSLNRRCSILHDSIEAARDLAYDLYNDAMDALDDVRDQLNYRIDSLAIDTRERISAAENLINANTVKINDLTERMEAAEDAIEGLDERLTDIEDKVQELDEKLNDLIARVDELEGRVDNLNDRLNSLITGIIVQGTMNTIYGTFYTPFGIESNVLAAYYGNNVPGTDEFPTAVTSYYYYPGEEDYTRGRTYLTAEEVGICTNRDFNEDQFYNRKDGNAGTIYLTVNSAANQDFTGVQFELVNTKDEAAQVTLSKLQPADWTKYFGFHTRSVENHLYSAQATIHEGFYKAAPKLNVSVDDLKAIFKDVKENAKTPSKIAIGTIAKTVYKAATSDILPAYGIKAPWNDSEGDHAVYSAYNVAATAIHPISYSFLAEDKFAYDHVPGLGRIESTIDKFADKVKKQLPKHLADEFDVKKFDLSRIVEVNLEDVDFSGFKVAVQFDDDIEVPIGDITVPLKQILVPGQTIDTTIPLDDLSDLYFEYVDPNTGLTVHENVQGLPEEMPVTITIEDQTVDVDAVTIPVGTRIVHLKFSYEDPQMTKLIQDKFNEMKEKLNINPMLEYIRGYLGSINDLIDRVNDYKLDKYVDNLVDYLKDYLDKVNAKLAPYMTISDWLQPFAVAYDGQMHRLTTSGTKAVRVKKDNLSLILTNRTAEILAPAYKKWVAVTKAYNADGTEAPASVVSAANTGELNKVLPGTTRRVNLNLKSGYTYVVCYQAMDYSGYVSAKRYLIKVK